MKVSFVYFACLALAVLVVLGQDQSGFISIDCGTFEGSKYTDAATGIVYTSDAGFIDSGESNTISFDIRKNYNFDQNLLNLRSFPEGTKNCYTLRPEQGRGNKYLIRARFLYGNYDGNNQLPQFNLHIGVDFWDTVKLVYLSWTMRYEIIHIPSTDYIHVCLVNTGNGTPFISVLELRPLNNLTYATTNGSLSNFWRYDLGAKEAQLVRYKYDVYDRMWMPFNFNYLRMLKTSDTMDSNGANVFQPPSKVTSTAIIPNTNHDSLQFSWETNSPTTQFYMYLYFAEVEVLKANQSREFNIYLNGQQINDDPVVPQYLATTTLYRKSAHESSDGKFELSIRTTSKSTHPPLLNAIEIYTVKQSQYSQTDDTDVQAMMSIKSMYGVTRNWQGDPCGPQGYVWLGLNCSYNGAEPPRIISMNLSSSGLNGDIAPYIANLTMIQSLDLSNNSLIGQVPDFLSQLASLKLLNLKGNNFTGSIPAELLARSKAGSLSLSIDGLEGENANLCQSIPCKKSKKKKKSMVVPIVASVAALCLLLIIAIMATLWIIKRRKQVVKKEDAGTHQIDRSPFEVKNPQLTYSEVMSITNNFERVVGRGGFGTVYHGYLGYSQVAVKMLSQSSVQGYKEFQAEANLLTSVRHKNLTSLVGYCDEGTNIGIIYEYMVNGNLRKHLLDRISSVLSWEKRLQIAIDAAQGLEYLHHGCKPPIIHRDVKSANILLNENFQAKLSDFGLSRVFPAECDTHVSTVVAGTPGYLDPEYCTSNRLTEKSDVYSFGIVLLEIITSRTPLIDELHISQWVGSKLANGDIKGIVDPRLQGDFDINSAWKAVDLAMTCVSCTSTQRPTMNFVVTELRDCLATEMDLHGIEWKDSIGVPSYLESEMNLPMVR